MLVFRRHLVSLSLETASRASTGNATPMVGDWRRVPLRAAKRTGEVCVAAYGNVQRGSRGHAGSAADYRASLWSGGIRRSARLLWAGRVVGSVGLAASPGKIVDGRCGGGSHLDLCRNDLCRWTSGDFQVALCGHAGGGGGLDRDSGLFECGGTDHVSGLCARTDALVLPVGVAGRHGSGCDSVGRAGPENWCSGCTGRGSGNAGVGSIGAARSSHHNRRTGVSSGGGSRLGFGPDESMSRFLTLGLFAILCITGCNRATKENPMETTAPSKQQSA